TAQGGRLLKITQGDYALKLDYVPGESHVSDETIALSSDLDFVSPMVHRHFGFDAGGYLHNLTQDVNYNSASYTAVNDVFGRLHSWTFADSTTSGGPGITHTYHFDLADQLIGEDVTGQSSSFVGYTYDVRGNRKTRSAPTNVATYT